MQRYAGGCTEVSPVKYEINNMRHHVTSCTDRCNILTLRLKLAFSDKIKVLREFSAELVPS